MLSGLAVSEKDELIPSSFKAIEVIYSVRPSGSLFVAACLDNVSGSCGNCVTIVYLFIVGVLLHGQFAKGTIQG